MSVLLANPDYLLEGFAEKRCHVSAVGMVTGLPSYGITERQHLPPSVLSFKLGAINLAGIY